MKNYCCKIRYKEFLLRDVVIDCKYVRVKVKCRGKFVYFYFVLEKIQLILFFFNQRVLLDDFIFVKIYIYCLMYVKIIVLFDWDVKVIKLQIIMFQNDD